MVQGRHRKPRHTAQVVSAVVAALAVLGGLWLTTGVGRVATESQSVARPAVAAASRPTTQQALSSSCPATVERAAALQAAARAAIQQWRVHVDAMNQLVAGKITLAQAQAFWAGTRVKGKQTQAAWHTADDAYRRAGGCVPVSARATGGPLATCARWQAAADRLFDAARTSLSLWDQHIADMEALRSGRMSAARAAAMWMMTWRKAGAGIAGYDRAYAAAVKLKPCPAG